MIIYNRLWVTMKNRGISQYKLIKDHKISSRNKSDFFEKRVDNMPRVLYNVKAV